MTSLGANPTMASSSNPACFSSSSASMSPLLDLSDQSQLELLLAGTADIHLKQHLFRQKFADRDCNAKSDYEAAKWCEQAEGELRSSVGSTELKTFYRALVCYNRAIAFADPNPSIPEPTQPNGSTDDVASELPKVMPECELSKTYLRRGELYLKQLSLSELGIRDLERAIVTSCSRDFSKRVHFILLEYLTIKLKDKLADNCAKALQLVATIEEKFSDMLSDDQKASLGQFRKVLEHQAALKSLNTINYSRKTLLQSLKCTRMPTVVEKDRPLVEKLFNNPEEPLVALADSIHCEDRLLKVKETRVEQSRLVLLEQAFAHVTTSQYSHCSSCLVPLCFFGALPCRSCSGHLYCSDQCVSKHWDIFHQFECGSEEKRSIWNRLDVLSKLTTRMLIRFGNSWTLMVDSTRECLCDKEGRFGNKVQFETKKTMQLRALLDWFKQGPGGEGLKLSMNKFISMLGQAYGVFSLLQEARDLTKSPLILPEYRAKLLHGIVLCRILLESGLASGIVGPVLAGGIIREQQQLRPFSVRDRVAKLVSGEDGDTSNLEKVFKELLEQEREFSDSRDLNNCPKVSAGLALYPTSVFLKRVNNQPEMAPNGTVLYSGTYRAIRSIRPIQKGHSIQVVLPTEEGLLDRNSKVMDSDVINQLAQDYANALEKTEKESMDCLTTNQLTTKQVEALNCELAMLQGLASDVKIPRPTGLQVALLMDMSRLHEKKGDFKEAVNCTGQCLELTREMSGERVEKLQQALMIRLGKMQFELFTEKDLAAKESSTLADHCLVNCSQVIMTLERTCLPLRVNLALMHAKQNPAVKESAIELSEQLIIAEGIPSLVELEEMMVAANMFSQKFQPGAAF